jgi:hypothetical protein
LPSQPETASDSATFLDLEADTKVYGAAVERTITEVAAEMGISSDALRYYERVGLLTPIGRTKAGYRLYSDEVIDRLRFIKAVRRRLNI